jgi:hypothetical protein
MLLDWLCSFFTTTICICWSVLDTHAILKTLRPFSSTEAWTWLYRPSNLCRTSPETKGVWFLTLNLQLC